MLGQKIKELRKQNNMNQSDLASVCGVTRSQIASIESNRGKPSYRVLLKMADHFRVPLDYFYDGQPEQAFVQALELSDEEFLKRVNLFFRGEPLTSDEIKSLLDYLRFLKSKSK